MNTVYELVCRITGDVVATEQCPGNAAELALAYSEVRGMHLDIVERKVETE